MSQQSILKLRCREVSWWARTDPTSDSGSFRKLLVSSGGRMFLEKGDMMHPLFRALVEHMHPAFDRLIGMEPVTAATVPKDAPSSCIYLFGEREKHLYVGRTKNLRERMGQHSRPGSQQNQAVFAFKLAREATGHVVADYTGEGRRNALIENEEFRQAFTAAKARVRQMDLRYVEETDSLRQALLEIYASVALETLYNDFDTH